MNLLVFTIEVVFVCRMESQGLAQYQSMLPIRDENCKISSSGKPLGHIHSSFKLRKIIKP